MNCPSTGLFFDGIDKHFGGTYALKDVSLSVARGEIVALLGENGAGKSTLIKVLGGIHAPDAGRVLIDGATYAHRPAGFGERQKVAFIHQDLGLIEEMDYGRREHRAVARFRAAVGLIRWDAVERFATEALRKVDCDFDPTTRVEDLTRTEKSLVAIARALAVDSEFLVLDEPTASLPADEVERLFAAIRPLRDRGVGMIYVSHRLDEIFRIADRVAVLRDGVLVGVRSIGHTTPEELVQKIVGRKTRETARPAGNPGARSCAWRRSRLAASARSTSRSGPTRSSASSDCAAPVTRRSAGRCSVCGAILEASCSKAGRRTSPVLRGRLRRESASSPGTGPSSLSR